MAIFNGAPPAFQSTQAAGTSVSTAGVQIYNAGSATVVNTAGTSHYAFNTGVILSNLTVINTGTATAYLGGGTSGTPSATYGLALPAGFQLTIQGTAASGNAAATASTFNLWAITTAGTTSIEAGLATVVAID
jgi:hypothetical protein